MSFSNYLNASKKLSVNSIVPNIGTILTLGNSADASPNVSVNGTQGLSRLNDPIYNPVVIPPPPPFPDITGRVLSQTAFASTVNNIPSLPGYGNGFLMFLEPVAGVVYNFTVSIQSASTTNYTISVNTYPTTGEPGSTGTLYTTTLNSITTATTYAVNILPVISPTPYIIGVVVSSDDPNATVHFSATALQQPTLSFAYISYPPILNNVYYTETSF